MDGIKWERQLFNAEDYAEYFAYLHRKREILLGPVQEELSGLDREMERVKVWLRGQVALTGQEVVTPHVSVYYRKAPVRLNQTLVKAALEGLERIVPSYPVIEPLVELLRSAFSLGDPTGSVTVTVPMAETEMQRWELLSEAKRPEKETVKR